MEMRRPTCLALLAMIAGLMVGTGARLAAEEGKGGKKGSNQQVMRGVVISVNTQAQSFVLQPKEGGNLTVTTSANTVYKRAGGGAAGFGEIRQNENVMVKGSPSGNGTFAAAGVMIGIPSKDPGSAPKKPKP
jgi:uncharacterized protein DUF5666